MESYLSLFFFDQFVFELTPNAQIWPRILNAALGGTAGSIYLVVSNFGDINPSVKVPGSFVLGVVFLERFYSVYDTGNRQVGLAKTPFTNATSN